MLDPGHPTRMEHPETHAHTDSPPPAVSPAATALWPRGHGPRWRQRALGVLLVLLVGGVYLWLANLLIAQTNHTDEDLLGGDQKNNLKLALQTRADLHPDFTTGISEPLKAMLPRRTDGVVNPLWPWVAAWFADPDHQPSGPAEVTAQDRALFQRGRWFNVGLTLGFLVVTGLALTRVFSLPALLTTVLLVGLGGLLPRAAWFQPEPLYFVFFTLTWIACLFALLRNTLWMYALIGLFSGLAWLAKGSVHPLLAVFIGVSTLRWLWGGVLARWPAAHGGTSLWVRRNHLFGLALLGFTHLMVASPRLAYAHERFGDPFHSYPAYWMWFDDFESCYAWMGRYNTREALAALPKDERPSFSLYRQTHTNEQITERLRHGVQVKLADLFAPGVTRQSEKNPKPWKGVLEHRGVYLGGLATICLGLGLFAACWRRREPRMPRLHPETASLALLVLGSFAAYTLAYGWYTPIGRGDRFMLSLYAPLVLSLVWAGESLRRRLLRGRAPRAVFLAYHGAHLLLIASIAWRLIEIAQWPQFRN